MISIPTRILNRVVGVGILALVVTTTVALIAAALGVFHAMPTIVAGVVGGLVGQRWWPRATEDRGPWPLLILLVVVVLTGLNAVHSSEQLFTGRDDGTYINTAISIAKTGRIPIDIGDGGSFPEESRAHTPGFLPTREGELAPEFFHAYPAILAVGISLGGLTLAGPLNAVLWGMSLALLGDFSLGRMRGWLALLTVAGVGLTLPFIYFSRAIFSEPLLLLGILGGLIVVDRVTKSASVRTGSLLAGSLFGFAVLSRLDGILLLVPLAVLIGVGKPVVLGLDVRWVARGVLALAAVGWIEAAIHAPGYLGAHMPEVVGAVGVCLAALGLTRWWCSSSQERTAALVRRSRQLSLVAACGLAVLVLLVVVMRPICCPSSTELPNSWVALAAQNEGLDYDPARGYEEWVPRSLVWYVGVPAFVVGLGGLGLALARFVRGYHRNTALLAIALAFSVHLLFPMITADQIWAARRILVPVLLWVVLAALLIEYALNRWPGRAKVMIGTAAIPVLLGGLLVTMPAIRIHDHAGLFVAFGDLCSRLGSGKVLVLDAPGEPTGQFLAQPIRGICGNEVRVMDVADLEGQLPELLLVARSEATLIRVASEVPATLLMDHSFPVLEPTITRPPAVAVATVHTFYAVQGGH